MKADVNRIKKDIETIATFTATPSAGVTRLPFTLQDKKAKEYIKRQMREAGLEVRADGVGTVIGKRNGMNANEPVIMMGSHYDSVKNGGAFDGVAGIVAALEVVRILNDEGIATRHPIEVVAMNDEEGVRFNAGMFSSRAMVGDITEKMLDAYMDIDGISIRQAMESMDIRPELNRAVREKGSIKAYLELHIEQGPVLEVNNKDIGIVENIVGLASYKVTILGRAGHAGTTPMDLRADALLAASKAVLNLNSIVKEIGHGMVGTIGKLNVLPGAPNVIPRSVEFSVDVRSYKEEIIEEGIIRFKRSLKLIEKEMGIKYSMQQAFYAPPVELSLAIREQFEKEALNFGYNSLSMNSGAGHDAMIMAKFAPTGMVFVPSKNGISHTPEEWTDYEQIQKGVMVLLNTAIALDSKN